MSFGHLVLKLTGADQNLQSLLLFLPSQTKKKKPTVKHECYDVTGNVPAAKALQKYD